MLSFAATVAGRTAPRRAGPAVAAVTRLVRAPAA